MTNSAISVPFRAALGLCIALGACGGGGGGGPSPGPDDLNARYEIMRDALSSPNVFNTAFQPPDNAVPASGNATFTGFVNLAATSVPEPLNLTGRARLEVDFGSRELTGSATGFESETASAYGGSINFVNGRIGRDAPAPTTQQPNDVRLEYVGALVGDEKTITFAGTASGKLKGSPIRGLVAASPPGDTATLNGSVIPVDFTLVAEKD